MNLCSLTFKTYGLQHPWTDLWISFTVGFSELLLIINLFVPFIPVSHTARTLHNWSLHNLATCTSSVLPQTTPVPGYTTDTFSPHYGTTSTCLKIALHSVPANISASTYPPLVLVSPAVVSSIEFFLVSAISCILVLSSRVHINFPSQSQ